MRESKIEAKLVKEAQAAGGMCLKFTSPARRNVPDRIWFRPIPPEHREIVGRYLRLIETKATGEEPNAGQKREHARLRALGFTVDVVTSIDEAVALVQEVSNG